MGYAGYGNDTKTTQVEEEYEDEERKELAPPSSPWDKTSVMMTTPAGDLAHEIGRIIFEIKKMPMDQIADNWDYLSQFFADVASRIPGITENKGAQFIRDFEDLSDLAHSQGFERVVRTKLLKHLYALRVEVAVSEVPLQGLSGVSSMLTTKNEAKTEAKITDARQQAPQSIFSGLSSILGKKDPPQQRRGGEVP